MIVAADMIVYNRGNEKYGYEISVGGLLLKSSKVIDMLIMVELLFYGLLCSWIGCLSRVA